ncbi:13124_t:CDS:2, partial [Ambispora leptoticha]
MVGYVPYFHYFINDLTPSQDFSYPGLNLPSTGPKEPDSQAIKSEQPDLQTKSEQLQEETASSIKTKNRGRPRKPNVTTSTNDLNEDAVAVSSPSTTTEATVQPPVKKARVERKNKNIKGKTKTVKEKTKVFVNEWVDDTYPINVKEQLITSSSDGKGAALAIKINNNKKGGGGG